MENGITYTEKGGFLFPNLVMEIPEEQEDVGKYGSMRLRFLQEHRRGRHSGSLLAGKLRSHLIEVNRETKARIESAMEEMLVTDPAPDKETDQMGWVRHMNRLNAAAEEIVIAETVYS